ncbi:hypothetical protein BJ166DRAFT_341172 [Pestalotiopsis sp. NC0098]|nr:hypothetical protein BJ166DRAFT_341172 [Pestalotiopsis sp. NC0098]
MRSSREPPMSASSMRAESCDAADLYSTITRLPALTSFLDADPRPTFLVPINEFGPLPFDLSFCNAAFREANFEADILVDTDEGRHFRAWSQVVIHWREEYDFGGRIWTAFKIQGQWKCIQATGISKGPEADSYFELPPSSSRALEGVNIADVRLASLYKMMEMSDVGTFEYSPQGKLLRANESWYRLSLHPPVENFADFSFMDLVYPADGPLVLSQWNKLAQGLPVTFEMRWKGKAYRDDATADAEDQFQWTLSACVPIQDDQGNLLSIAGNTIDINAQKMVQEEAVQRAEALERARRSERKFARFALLAPIAIYICDVQGRMTYCNNRFFELTGHPVTEEYKNINWDYVAFPEDQSIVDGQWKKLVHEKQRATAHFRLRHTWGLGDGNVRQAWIECQAFPELDQEGKVVSIFGTMTDISRFKWAEDIQKSRVQEALDAKHKHENFIDMTSHEMRNPLSAVIQCADSTIDSLKLVSALSRRWRQDDTVAKQVENELNLCLDSLHTIISCSNHQKRVIDDVLTLSKMDSNLLAITPVRVNSATIVAEAVHMFQIECQKDGIELEFIEDPSLEETGSRFVMMDPSRVLQVLINLLTNAIKFTRDRPRRKIEVILGGHTSKPLDGFRDIPFASVTTEAPGLLDNEDWGAGREVYVWIQCRDTGCGMSTAEQVNLFTRFSQATPRTHIRYGGSGLGLFISKKLTELQGGAIGVQSEPDVGSTFAFFVATRTAAPPTPAARFDMLDHYPLTRVLSKDGHPKEGEAVLQESLEKVPKYSVLVVEDNLVNQKVLSQQLRKAGCEVHVANHGQEVLEFLRKTEYWKLDSKPIPAPSSPSSSTAAPAVIPNGTAPTATALSTPPPSSSSAEDPTAELQPRLKRIKLSVILMDIEMPVMDGLTCTQRIRSLQENGQIVSHVPIMAVSANARSEQMAHARDVGMDDAISKPFRIPELMPKIEALVRGDGPLVVVPAAAPLP